MNYFTRKGNELFCEDVAVSVLAREYGTPLYVYSKNGIVERCRRYMAAFRGAKLCFALKSNSNPSVLKLLVKEGFGMDVVSLGEMERALGAGALPADIIFSGVGKTDAEITRGLELGIFSFNVESIFELEAIARLAPFRSSTVRISFRINPNVDAKTIPYIATGLYENKFGVPENAIPQLLEIIRRELSLHLVGIGCHLGSQLLELEPYRLAASRLSKIARELVAGGFKLEFMDMGGGLGVAYKDETPPSIEEYATVLLDEIDETKRAGLKLVIEPGRSVIAESGILVASVLGCKVTPRKQFCVVDAAMNDLIRPSLYKAVHRIEAVSTGPSLGDEPKGSNSPYDVVGPICETGDFLGKDISLPDLKRGDLIVIFTAGAYGMSMASNYNARPRAAEVWVDGNRHEVIRARENLEDVY